MHRELRLIFEIQMMKLLSKLRRSLKCGAKNIFYIGGSDVLPPPLEKDEEEQILTEHAGGNPEARSILIERNLRLVVYIARRFENTGVQLDDLISVGSIGLIKAINSYNLEKNIIVYCNLQAKFLSWTHQFTCFWVSVWSL